MLVQKVGTLDEEKKSNNGKFIRALMSPGTSIMKREREP